MAEPLRQKRRACVASLLTLWLAPLEVRAEEATTALPQLRLEEAVARALANHPALRQAAAELDRATAQTAQARAPALPSLSATGAYTRLDAERTFGDRTVAAQEQLSASATLGVPLVAPPRWAQWARVARSEQAIELGREEARRQVAVTAARSWLQVLGQRRVLEAGERARDTAQAHLDFASERFKGGVGTRLDVLRASQELAVAQTQVAQAKGQLARLRENLGIALGSDEPQDVVADEPALAAALTRADALASAEHRPDARAALARREAAELATRLQWAEHLPLLTASMQPFFQNPPTLVQPQLGWQAQLVLSLPLYEGGLRSAQGRERAAQLDTARAQAEALLRQARAETRAAFEGVRAADEALRAARQSAALAQQALELASVAYRAGATTNLEVTDAERRARDAETAAAVAEDAARQARLELLAASGRFP